MRDFSREPGVTFTFVYDFGDNWRHTVTIEKLMAAMPAPKKPSCIDGARCCPPEDVGGTSGYFEFLRVLLAPDSAAAARSRTETQAAKCGGRGGDGRGIRDTKRRELVRNS